MDKKFRSKGVEIRKNDIVFQSSPGVAAVTADQEKGAQPSTVTNRQINRHDGKSASELVLANRVPGAPVVYQLVLRAAPDSLTPEARLKRLLKFAWRSCRLRCVRVQPIYEHER